MVTSALTLIGVTPASANPELSARVYLRVEGASTTIFEGWVTTVPHYITTASGGTHLCDGLNNHANANPGPTPTDALDDASNIGGFTFDGTFDAASQDYFIQTIGPDASTPTQFWGLLVNDKFTPVSGCQFEIKDGDQVLWAYNAFNANHFLALTGPSSATTNVPFKVTVTDGSTGQPIQGATVGGQTTAADGTATLTEATPGIVSLKATAPNSIRSNALAVDVQNPQLTPQNITFPKLPNRSIVESPFTITGVTGGGSGNPVTFTAAGGNCTVAATTVTLKHTGKCTITAHQAAAPGFAAAQPVSRSFMISAAPALLIGDASTPEGNSGTHPLTFTVTLVKAVSVPVTVHWMTADNTAKAPSDYVAGSGTLSFAPGQTSGTISVLIKGDRMKEPNEVFFVLLDSPHNATIADGSGTGGILNDD